MVPFVFLHVHGACLLRASRAQASLPGLYAIHILRRLLQTVLVTQLFDLEMISARYLDISAIS